MDLSDVQSGDLLFCSGRGELGRLIRWFTGSPYGHVGTVLHLDDEPSQLYLVQSLEPNGVQLVPLVPFIDAYDGLIWTVTVTGYDDATMRKKLIALAFPALGEPYDMREIAELILHEQGRPMERTRFICSVFTEYLWAGIGLSLTTEEVIAPSTVAESPRLTNWRQVKYAG